MICFQTKHFKLYNYLIHGFLEMEVFDGETDIGDMIEGLLPKYLYREQYMKCVKTFEELYDWTSDSFYHDMSAFHEVVLYNFLEYMADLREDDCEFDDIYIDDEGKNLIEEAIKYEVENRDIENETYEEVRDYFYDISWWSDSLFRDTDFLFINKVYNQRKLGDVFLEERLSIDIDFYYEILPLDIREKYKSRHITLMGEVSEFIDFVQKKVCYGSLSRLFWENGKPIAENKIQIILENLMDSYFYNSGVEVNREVLLGSGKVDFKLYKNEDEKLLIEVKKASSSYLKKGYEKQLLEYMRSTSYKNAIYLIICFTDYEYDKAKKLIKENVYTDMMQLYVSIAIMDVRKKVSATGFVKNKVS